MTLPTSGPLSLSDIQGEFGGSNPISLNEYYAGGGLVPAGTTGTNGAVPSSGTISISNFYGTSNQYVAFDDTSAYDFVFSPMSALASYQISATGYVNATGVSSVQWCFPTSATGNFEVYASLNSGSLTSGTLNSWVACSGSPVWYCNQGGFGIKTANLSFQARRIGTTTVLDTWTVDITAEVEP